MSSFVGRGGGGGGGGGSGATNGTSARTILRRSPPEAVTSATSRLIATTGGDRSGGNVNTNRHPEHNHNTNTTSNGGESDDPDSIMIRSLRRQLYEALSCDDAPRAIEIFLMTRTQYWEQCCVGVASPPEQHHVQTPTTTTTTRHHHKPQQPQQQQQSPFLLDEPSQHLASMGGLDKTPVLAEIMNPLDPFQPDDAKSYLDQYTVEGSSDMTPPSSSPLPPPPALPRTLSFRLLLRRHGGRRGTGHHRAATADPPPGALLTTHDGGTAAVATPTTTTTTATTMSTPLHQAARLGSLDLLRVFLAVVTDDQDLDVRDGQGRTVLHCLAGSVGKLPPPPAPPIPPPPPRRNKDYTNTTKRFVDELLLRRHRHPPKTPVLHDMARTVPSTTMTMTPPKPHYYTTSTTTMTSSSSSSAQQSDRVQMAHLLLSHGSNSISTNAVDKSLGRTALHYAAERHWSVLCDVLLQTSAFDTTMLTVVDTAGRTPAELAAMTSTSLSGNSNKTGADDDDDQGGGHSLSASLEAKCLLAVDPYGTMADQFGIASTTFLHSNNNDNSTATLANPFGWFETNNIRRQARVQQALTKIQTLTQDWLTRNLHLVDGGSDDDNDTIVIQGLPADPRGYYHTTLPMDPRGYYHTNHDHDDAMLPPNDALSTNGGSGGDPASLTTAVAVATPVQQQQQSRELAAIPNSHLLTHLHEAHVEVLLEYYKWNVKEALQKFFAYPFETLALAGIDLTGYDNALSSSSLPQQEPKTCQICYEEDVADDDWRRLTGCGHGYCTNCLQSYLEDRVSAKQSGIACPHHDCSALLSPLELRSLLPNESKYNDMADERFVMSCPEYRYCPEPGCGRPVRINLNAMPGSRTAIHNAQDIVKLVGAVCTHNPDAPVGSPLTYEGVPDPNYYSLTDPPRRAHRFCFVCGDRQIHWPVDCKKLREWKATIKKHANEAGVDGDAAGANHDDIAQTLWMKTNTRPCPKCNAPIQKNEGCNHMTCLNPHCKHEFCWICRHDWKKHNTSTGGFFRCNRWAEENDHQFYDGTTHNNSELLANPFEDLMDPRTLNVTYGTAMHESLATRERTSKMDRFIHHYQRWSAHRDSAALERRMWEEAVPRLAPVVDEMLAFTGSDHLFGGKGLSFIHAAFMELLESRSMLQHSYAFSYLRYMSELRRGWKRREKSDFERAQSELELLTEQISDVVARKHIRATQEQIVYLTKATAQKRNDFSNTMVSCLQAEAQEEQDRQQRVQQEQGNNDGGAGIGSSGTATSATTTMTRESPARTLLRQSLGDLLAEDGLAALLDYDSDDDDEDRHPHNGIEDWMCPACTFVNTGRRRCEMCNGYRPR